MLSLWKPQILINFYSIYCMILMISINLTCYVFSLPSWITKRLIIFIDFLLLVCMTKLQQNWCPQWWNTASQLLQALIFFDYFFDCSSFSSFLDFLDYFSHICCHWSTFKYWSISFRKGTWQDIGAEMKGNEMKWHEIKWNEREKNKSSQPARIKKIQYIIQYKNPVHNLQYIIRRT